MTSLLKLYFAIVFLYYIDLSLIKVSIVFTYLRFGMW